VWKRRRCYIFSKKEGRRGAEGGERRGGVVNTDGKVLKEVCRPQERKRKSKGFEIADKRVPGVK